MAADFIDRAITREPHGFGFRKDLGPTSEWDTAAAQAVLEAAGGAVVTLEGRVLRYNERDTLLNPHFLAVGDTSRDWRRLF